jgi:hypothetical protein
MEGRFAGRILKAKGNRNQRAVSESADRLESLP